MRPWEANRQASHSLFLNHDRWRYAEPVVPQKANGKHERCHDDQPRPTERAECCRALDEDARRRLAVLVAALVAAALANVCAARTGDAGIADSDTVGSIAPAPIERSGSLAVYPLLY